jgi:uncharacterized membrane protein (DUF4010 family)
VDLAHFLSFIYALAIGLLIGGERERSRQHGEVQAFGIRTFALLSLIGALAALLGPWVELGSTVAVTALLVLGYRRTYETHPGAVTEAAGFATLLLGMLTRHDAPLAAGIAIIIAVLLASKRQLHAFVRHTVSDIELEDALKFLVVAFVVLPLLPNRSLGPYGVLNPSRIWLIVVAFTGISWVCYLAVRTLGARRGLSASAFASGFVSATMTTAAMGRLARAEALRAPAVTAAQLASVATYVQLLSVSFVVSSEVAIRLVAPSLLSGSVLVTWAWLRARGHPESPQPEPVPMSAPPEQRAFAIRPALVLTAILTVATLVGRWGAATFGAKGAVAAAGLVGFADAHGGALGAISLFAHRSVSLTTALVAVAVALSANVAVKCVLAFSVGGGDFGRRFSFAVVVAQVVFVGLIIVSVAFGW